MTSKINAATASGGGLISTADASGILVLQTAGVAAVTIDATQNVVFANTISAPNVAVNGPAFSAYQSTLQTLASSAFTKIIFQTEEWDTANCFDNSSASRFTPNVAGYYQISGAVAITTTPCAIYTYLYKNGAIHRALGSNGGTLGSTEGSALVYCNGTTDYLEMFSYFSTGQDTNTGIAYTFFQAFLARRA